MSIKAEFYSEVNGRKNIARSASHRINGSKSKKCTFPSDNLTPAQKKKLNGACVMYNLGAPMTWEEFKNLPVDLSEEYACGLREKYRVSAADLGEMFGVTRMPVINHMTKLGYCERFLSIHGKRSRMTDEYKEAWEKFLHPEPVESDAIKKFNARMAKHQEMMDRLAEKDTNEPEDTNCVVVETPDKPVDIPAPKVTSIDVECTVDQLATFLHTIGIDGVCKFHVDAGM